MTATTPTHALETLRAAAASGSLTTVCARHDVALPVAFVSAVNGPVRDHARDLDIAVLTENDRSRLELLAELSDVTHFEAIDLLDPGRAGPVATVEALAKSMTQLLTDYDQYTHEVAPGCGISRPTPTDATLRCVGC